VTDIDDRAVEETRLSPLAAEAADMPRAEQEDAAQERQGPVVERQPQHGAPLLGLAKAGLQGVLGLGDAVGVYQDQSQVQLRVQTARQRGGAARAYLRRTPGEVDRLVHPPMGVGGDGQGLQPEARGNVVAQPLTVDDGPLCLLGRPLDITQEQLQMRRQRCRYEPLRLVRCAQRGGRLQFGHRCGQLATDPQHLPEGTVQRCFDRRLWSAQQNVAGQRGCVG